MHTCKTCHNNVCQYTVVPLNLFLLPTAVNILRSFSVFISDAILLIEISVALDTINI